MIILINSMICETEIIYCVITFSLKTVKQKLQQLSDVWHGFISKMTIFNWGLLII